MLYQRKNGAAKATGHRSSVKKFLCRKTVAENFFKFPGKYASPISSKQFTKQGFDHA